MTAGPPVDETSTPRFAAHVRFSHDRTRDRWVIQAPERVLLPDEIAVDVLRCVDGTTTVGGIVDALAVRFNAPREEILDDVIALLRDLAEKGVLTS